MPKITVRSRVLCKVVRSQINCDDVIRKEDDNNTRILDVLGVGGGTDNREVNYRLLQVKRLSLSTVEYGYVVG